MTTAPLASTIIAVGLIPVAFLFVHAYLSGRSKHRFHPVTGTLAITWDLAMSIGYMLLRTVTITLTPLLTVYFGIHGAIAVLVMSLEVAVLAIGFLQVKQKTPNKWHGKLVKFLFPVWWFAFLSGEIVYLLMYVF
jgi:uncharacterized membrane protein YozB (DUF420 family)